MRASSHILGFRGQWQRGRPRDPQKGAVMKRMVRWRWRGHMLVLPCESLSRLSLLLLPSPLRRRNLGRRGAKVHFFSVSMLWRPVLPRRTATLIGTASWRRRGEDVAVVEARSRDGRREMVSKGSTRDGHSVMSRYVEEVMVDG